MDFCTKAAAVLYKVFSLVEPMILLKSAKVKILLSIALIALNISSVFIVTLLCIKLYIKWKLCQYDIPATHNAIRRTLGVLLNRFLNCFLIFFDYS